MELAGVAGVGVGGCDTDFDDEEDDADDESSCSQQQPRRSHGLTSSSGRPTYPYVPRRERSHSTVSTSSNPYVVLATSTTPSVTSTSSNFLANPLLGVTSEAAKIKRRSISSCVGPSSQPSPLSMSPPKLAPEDSSSKLPNPDVVVSSSSAANKPPIIGGVRLRENRHHNHHHHNLGSAGGAGGRHGAHVRFSNIEDRASAGQFLLRYPYLDQSSLSVGSGGGVIISSVAGAAGGHRGKCSSGISDWKTTPTTTAEPSGGGSESRKNSETGDAPTSPAAAGASEKVPPPHAVQRTQSNPEMESCPVCLARKECEILLKRTYSKVRLKSKDGGCYC